MTAHIGTSPCPTHMPELRNQSSLPCPWCVIDEWRVNGERLRKIESVARELITTGMKNNGEHLIVVEKKDKSDPHYRLCDLLEPRTPRQQSTKAGSES